MIVKKDYRTRSQKVQDAVFASEMAAPDWDEHFAEMQAEEDRYEAEKEAAALRLNAQFPKIPTATWLSAIENTFDPMGRPVQFTSSDKKAAFSAEIAKL